MSQNKRVHTDSSFKRIRVTKCLNAPDYNTGDSSLAILSSHNKKYTSIVAQLGYIDTSSATVEEVYHNLKLGFMVFPLGNYEVCSFCLSLINKKTDPIGPMCYNGNKIPKNLYWFYGSIYPSTLLEFTNIRMRKKGTENTMPLPNFWIKVR